MKTIELTPAELELIQVKREQEELAAKEKEAQKKFAIEQEVERAKQQIRQWETKMSAQVKATEDFAVQLPNAKYHVEERALNKKVSYAGEEVAIIKYLDKEAHLELDGYKIQVKEHIVYSSSSWRSSGRSQGYKMYVRGKGISYKTENRGYKNAKKVAELIKETIEAIEAQKVRENKQKNAVTTAVENFKQQFPEAAVSADRGCKINPYGNASNRYTEYDRVTVVLPNGIEMEYRVYENGQLERQSLRFPQHDAMELVSMLSNLEFPTKK